jgi:predicted Ser/Thr protein kinase
MSDAPDQGQVSSSPLRQIDVVADCFEKQWQLGDSPPISEYLTRVPPALKPQLLVELVCIDLEQRLRRALPATLDDYYRQFPELNHLPPEERSDLEHPAWQRSAELGSTVDHPAPTAPTMPDSPARIGRFPIAGRVGSGGQAEVFLSFHPELRVPVVIKWCRRQVHRDNGQSGQLGREGQILAGLQIHPNLLRVYDLGLHEGRPFLVLEFIQGPTLQQYRQQEQPSPRRVAELVLPLAQAIHAAHQQGVIHQDINPRNVLIDSREQPRLIDFGLAWFQFPLAGADHEVRPEAGTLEYLSPEQAEPAISPVGPRTDVFGLGGVLYYLLTGRPLYQAATVQAILQQAARAAYDASPLDSDHIPKPLAAVCRKALARNPQDRFASAADLAITLKAAVRPPRWRMVAALTGVLFAAIACGLLLGHLGGHTPPSMGEVNQAAMEVRIWRAEAADIPLRQALPLRTGDELQIRFHVPARLHVGLCSINGQGKLSLLQRYPPQEAAAELIYPAPSQVRELLPPAGTEFLLVCGRAEAALSEPELQAAWDSAAPWPEIAPPARLLRLQPDQLREEGERPRDLGATRPLPGSMSVPQRLEGFRERLRPMCSFFEGLAFCHE